MNATCKTTSDGTPVITQRKTCPMETTLGLIGGKWKPIILWHLYDEGTLRFSEIKRAIPHATEKMLTQHLRELESDRLVHRHVFAQVPPKVEYSLTEHGVSLGPLLVAMHDWGVRYSEAERTSAAHAQDAPAARTTRTCPR